MRALFDCRLEDIGRFDRVKVECACGREVVLPPETFNGLPNYTRVLDLQRRLRCDNCGERDRVIVSVVWANYASRRG